MNITDGDNKAINRYQGNNIRLRVYILSLYILILPIDASLGNIIGPTSIINYVLLLYVLIRLNTILKQRIKIKVLRKCILPIIYFLYFIISISWAINQYVSTWHVSSLIGAFTMFILAVIDNYTEGEYYFLRKSIVASAFVVIIAVFINKGTFSEDRLILNFGRYMDPNFFAVGLVLINAVLMDNIMKKQYLKRSLIAIIFLFIVIIMTGSRGGLLANTFVILTYFIMSDKSFISKLLFLAVGFIMFLLIFNIIKDYIPPWVLDRFELSKVTSSGGSGRTKIWADNLSYYMDSSLIRLIVGYGFSSFSVISMKTLGAARASHNIYIQSLIEGGIVGFSILIMMIIIIIRNALKENNIYIIAATVGLAIGGVSLDIHISRFFWNILFFAII